MTKELIIEEIEWEIDLNDACLENFNLKDGDPLKNLILEHNKMLKSLKEKINKLETK